MKTLFLSCFVLCRLLSAQNLSLKPNAWRLYQVPYTTGRGNLYTLELSKSTNGSLSFSFPDISSGQYANYLYTTHVPNQISGTFTMTIEIATTGNPVFFTTAGETCSNPLPSAIHPFFWSNNFGWEWNNRWWANSTWYVLGPGTVTMTIPLLPSYWLNVNGSTPGSGGSASLEAFQTALSDVNAIGMTFGGNCSFGHGVSVGGGTANFQLRSFGIVP